MTDPRDPVEDWLSTEVELLPPPPGAYQRVLRRARRRRTARAIVAGAGAIAVVAALAAVPRLAVTLFSGSTGSSVAAESPGSPPHGSGLHRAPNGPKFTPVRTSAPAAGGPALSAVGSGLPPAAGFLPTSVTFVGPSIGAAIGQARTGCGTRSCTAVAGTSSYGTSWFAVGAPDAGPAGVTSAVSQIRFLDLSNGWAYGPGLWATHDGGATWQQITGLPAGRVIDLSTVGSRVFAVLAACAPTSAPVNDAVTCTSFELISAAADSNRWAPVPGAAAQLPVLPGGLQLTTVSGYLLAQGHLFTGPVTGGAWHQVPVSPSAGPPCLGSGAGQQAGRHLPVLIAPTAGELFLACGAAPSGGQPALYGSPDAGQTWTALGPMAVQGFISSLAATPDGTLVLATSAGIFYSAATTGYRTWRQASVPVQVAGAGFTFVGMTTNALGVAVPADPALHELLVTRDGGASWQPSLIP